MPLKSNSSYLNVRWLLNYPLLLLIAGALILILIVVWIVFGKKIRRYLLLRRLNKNHLAFMQRFTHHIETLRQAERFLVGFQRIGKLTRATESIAFIRQHFSF